MYIMYVCRNMDYFSLQKLKLIFRSITTTTTTITAMSVVSRINNNIINNNNNGIQ